MKKLTALILATALLLTLTFTSCDMIGGSVNPPSASTKKGDIVRFGQHDWRVLYVRSGSALLLSDEVIEKRPYHTVSIGITWENSSIREYLNGDFYNNIFTEEEKDKINDTDNDNKANPWFETAGGNKTTDKVFLLSLDEVIKYFGDSGQLDNPNIEEYGGGMQYIQKEVSDEFNEERFATDAETGRASPGWWTRTPGMRSELAVDIDSFGRLNVTGTGVEGGGRKVDDVSHPGGMRPAMWIELE